MKVVEHKRVVVYLRKRNLLTQYQKAKQLLLQNLFGSVALKKRNPKSSNIWYFRINKQYRALCIRENGMLIVFAVDDHQ